MIWSRAEDGGVRGWGRCEVVVKEKRGLEDCPGPTVSSYYWVSGMGKENPGILVAELGAF